MALDRTDDDEDRAAIAALWVGAQGRVLDRIDSIDAAIAALASGPLGDEDRAVAVGEAHKLAGSLGTFGVPEGSRQAKALELLLEHADPSAAAEAAGLAAALRAAVETGPTDL
jgi:HPt (histidine-containing phosphotransfer) domain-containing protein